MTEGYAHRRLVWRGAFAAMAVRRRVASRSSAGGEVPPWWLDSLGSCPIGDAMAVWTYLTGWQIGGVGEDMAWELKTIEVSRRYNNRAREYRWERGDEDVSSPLAGWYDILASEAGTGWELVNACVDSYQENNTNMEATGYRLFFRRAVG